MSGWSHGSQALYYMSHKVGKFREIKVWHPSLDYMEVEVVVYWLFNKHYELKEGIAITHELKDEFSFKGFWYLHFYNTQVEY